MTSKPITQSVKSEYWSVLFHSVITFMGHSIMQIVDLYFCKSLGSQASATVGSGSALFAWLLIAGLGLTYSLEYFVPHAIGEKDEAKAQSFFYSGIGSVFILGAISSICLYFLGSFTHLMGFNPDIVGPVRSFTQITALSYIPVFIIPLLRVELQGRGHPHVTTLAFIFANILNVFLNWAFVLGNAGFPAMGTNGSAYANLLSRCSILLFLLIWYFAIHKKIHRPLTLKQIEFKNYSLQILKKGLPISLHFLFEMGAFVFVSLLAAHLAAYQNAAHTISITLASFSFMIPLGISSAAALTMSKANGEKNVAEAIRLGKMSIWMGVVFAVFASAIFILGRFYFLSLYSLDPDTIRVGSQLLIIVAIFQFGDAMQVILSGCLRGFGLTGIQAKMNAFGHWCIGIPLGVFLGFNLDMNIIGLWIGLCVGLWVVAGGLYYWWRKAAFHHGV